MPVHPLLQARSLSKQYTSGTGNRVMAVDNVNLDVWPGEFVMIAGPSGCGKSTLLALIGGLERPTAGTVRLNDTSLAGLSDKQKAELRRFQVGFIFQSFHLIPYLNALENVMLPLSFKPISHKQRRLRALEVLHSVGLHDRADHYPAELSGGQQQRVAIARALANSPSLILADEPTGNLDTTAGGRVIQIFSALNRHGGHTVVLVTHDTSLSRYVHRVVHLRDGRVVDEEPGGAEVPKCPVRQRRG